MRYLTPLLLSLCFMGMSLSTTPQANALLPKFGAKLGKETFNSNLKGKPDSGQQDLSVDNAESGLEAHFAHGQIWKAACRARDACVCLQFAYALPSLAIPGVHASGLTLDARSVTQK